MAMHKYTAFCNVTELPAKGLEHDTQVIETKYRADSRFAPN